MERESIENLDLREFLAFNRKCLHCLGYFYPEFTKSDKMKETVYRIYVIIFVGFAFVLSLISQIGFMVVSFGDLEKMTEASFLLFTNFVQCLKLYCFMGYGSRIWKLVHSMNRPIFKPQSKLQYDILKQEIRKSKIISKLFLLACTLTCASWGLSPLVDKRGEKTIRLPLSGWYPFSTDNSGNFIFAYCYQLLTTWIGGLGDLSMDTFISGLIMFTSAQLSLLNNFLEIMKLKNSTDSKKREQHRRELNECLVRCVLHYRNIIEFSNEVTFLFTAGITGQFVIGVIIICMSMFQMSLVSVLSFRFLAMMLYQICVSIEIYLSCFYGNEIILKSDQLTQSAYLCEWIDAPNEFKQNLIIFMTRTQFPLRLYASGYFTLSLETFKAIVKSSWSYFAVLNQVHHQKTS